MFLYIYLSFSISQVISLNYIYTHLGSNVTINCTMKNSSDLTEVQWEKDYHLISTLSLKTNTITIVPKFQSFVQSNYSILNNSELFTYLNYSVKSVYDEGCFKCLFIGLVKPSKKTCIRVYMDPIMFFSYRYLRNYLDVTCSATSYPKPLIAITFMKEAYKQDNPNYRINNNGSISVTLSFIFKKSSDIYMGKSLSCFAVGGQKIEKITKHISIGSYRYVHTNTSLTAIEKDERMWLMWVLLCFLLIILCFLLSLALLCRKTLKSM